MIPKEDLDNWFVYHAPSEGQPATYQFIRNMAHQFAEYINELCPDSQEKDAAIHALREAVMWANAGIACKGDSSHVPKRPDGWFGEGQTDTPVGG